MNWESAECKYDRTGSNYRSKGTDCSNEISLLTLKEVSLSAESSKGACEVARRCILRVSQSLRCPRICTVLPEELAGRCHLQAKSTRLIREFSDHGHRLWLLLDRLWLASCRLWMDVFLPCQSCRWVYDVGHGRARHDGWPFPWIKSGVFIVNRAKSQRPEIRDQRPRWGRWSQSQRWEDRWKDRASGLEEGWLVPKMTYAKGGRVKWARTSEKRKRGYSLVPRFFKRAGVGREVKGDVNGLLRGDYSSVFALGVPTVSWWGQWSWARRLARSLGMRQMRARRGGQRMVGGWWEDGGRMVGGWMARELKLGGWDARGSYAWRARLGKVSWGDACSAHATPLHSSAVILQAFSIQHSAFDIRHSTLEQ